MEQVSNHLYLNVSAAKNGPAQVTESHIRVRSRLPGTRDDQSGVCEVVGAGCTLGGGRRAGYIVGVRR